MNQNDWNRTITGRVYNGIAWLMLAAVAAQVFLAGYAVTADPAAWLWHIRFVHFLETPPLVLAGIAGFGKGPRLLLWLPLVVFGLIWLQYLLINVPSGIVNALHPTNAIAIAILAWTAARVSLPKKEKVEWTTPRSSQA